MSQDVRHRKLNNSYSDRGESYYMYSAVCAFKQGCLVFKKKKKRKITADPDSKKANVAKTRNVH